MPLKYINKSRCPNCARIYQWLVNYNAFCFIISHSLSTIIITVCTHLNDHTIFVMVIYFQINTKLQIKSFDNAKAIEKDANFKSAISSLMLLTIIYLSVLYTTTHNIQLMLICNQRLTAELTLIVYNCLNVCAWICLEVSSRKYM